MSKEARPYQLEAIDAVHKAFETYPSTVLVLPTGAGKTFCAADIMTKWQRGNSLFLAHTKELIEQSAATLALEMDGIKPIIEMNVQGADKYTIHQGGLVVVGSVQSMYSDRRLEKYGEHPFGLIVIDECVTGETLINTDKGIVRIDSIDTTQPSIVMTYDGESVCNRKILSFTKKGQRPVLKVTTASGRMIRCTGNHQLYTNRGWINAEDLDPIENHALCVNADVERRSGETNGELFSVTSLGTQHLAGSESGLLNRVDAGAVNWQVSANTVDPMLTSKAIEYSRKNQLPNGSVNTPIWWRDLRYAIADAESKLGQKLRCRITSKTKADHLSQDTLEITVSDHLNGLLNLLKLKGKRFLERCLEIAAFCTRMPQAAIQEFVAIMADYNANGFNTKRMYCQDLEYLLGNAQVPGMVNHQEKQPYRLLLLACHALMRSMISSNCLVKNELRENGSIRLATSGSRGGYAMMVARQAMGLLSILKDILKPRYESQLIGLPINSAQRAYIAEKANTSFLDQKQLQGELYSKLSIDMSLSACSISYDPVVSVQEDGTREVFDIGVEGTHCFFANGILVHNCHRAVGAIFRKVVNYFKERNPDLKVLGVTATPTRGDGTSLGLVFESTAYQMTINSAIDGGWLVPITQKVVSIECLDFSGLRTRLNEFGERDFSAEKVEEIIMEEESLQAFAKSIIELSGDRSTLIFMPGVQSAHLIASILNRYKERCAEAADGETPKDVRPDIVERFKTGKTQFLANALLYTEGADFPRCSCIAMCRFTKSIGRYIQMMGRGLRPLPGTVDGLPDDPFERKMAILKSDKPDCLILDFSGCSEHKLVDVWDVLGGNYDEETIELAEQHGDKKNISEDLEKAQLVRQLMLQWEERKQIIADAVKYKTYDVNPFGSMKENRASAANAPTSVPARGGATDGQVGLLIKLGVKRETAEAYSKRQAGAVIQQIGSKRCTDPQAKALRSNGINPEGISMDRASNILDALSQNKWKPLTSEQLAAIE